MEEILIIFIVFLWLHDAQGSSHADEDSGQIRVDDFLPFFIRKL
jgi:hypothetical protein